MPPSIQNIARLRWRCRRGMLELDVLLQPFFDDCFVNLSAEQQADFADLLEQDDHKLFTWLMSKSQCHQPNLLRIIQKIVTFNQTRIH